MKPTQATANPLLLARLGCWLVAEALATFLISLAALVLTIAGWIVLA
jgi:hypothetical protein